MYSSDSDRTFVNESYTLWQPTPEDVKAKRFKPKTALGWHMPCLTCHAWMHFCLKFLVRRLEGSICVQTKIIIIDCIMFAFWFEDDIYWGDDMIMSWRRPMSYVRTYFLFISICKYSSHMWPSDSSVLFCPTISSVNQPIHSFARHDTGSSQFHSDSFVR